MRNEVCERMREGFDIVAAVCLAENYKTTSLNVLLAVNKAEAMDAKQLLQKLKLGFEEIFAALAKAGDSKSVAYSQNTTPLLTRT